MEMYEDMINKQQHGEDKGEEEFSYKGYEIVHGAFFAHLFEPSVKLVRETVSVNAACIRKLPDTEYVQFLVNRDDKKLAVKPCTEDTKDSFRWSTVGKDGKKRPRTITCKPFFAKIVKLMGWDPDKRYRILGKLIRTKTVTIFVFDLKDPECFVKKERTAYPDDGKECFGLPVEEHENAALVSFCEDSSVFYLKKDEVEYGRVGHTQEAIRSIGEQEAGTEVEIQKSEVYGVPSGIEEEVQMKDGMEKYGPIIEEAQIRCETIQPECLTERRQLNEQ